MEHDADVFSREPNGLIALRMTQEDWDELSRELAYAFLKRDNDMDKFRILRLVNRLNAGNPDFIPYEVHAEAQP